ncbi:HNH endonuclease (plasmid) [Burkholderia vietnamiensis]
MYNRHRPHDPNTGRFVSVSKDAIGLAGGFNVYQYAPNPILWTDALGLARELSGCDSSNRPLSSIQYSVLHEVQLAPGQEVGSDPSHFREANRQFDAAMQSDPQFKQMMDQHYSGVSDHVAAGPRGGYKSSAPPGFSWHHHPCRKGVLQLVPMSQHQAPGPVQAVLHPGGQGGKQNWGGGRAR